METWPPGLAPVKRFLTCIRCAGQPLAWVEALKKPSVCLQHLSLVSGGGEGRAWRRQGPCGATDVNLGWVVSRQEGKLSWQRVLSAASYKALCFFELLPSHWICSLERSCGQERGQMVVSLPERLPVCMQGSRPVLPAAALASLGFCCLLAPWIFREITTLKHMEGLQGWPLHLLLSPGGEGDALGMVSSCSQAR